MEFSGNHTHYWVQNLSDGDVLASLSGGITEGADNVLTIPAGGAGYVRDDKGASSVYLLGTGKVQIYGKSNEFCPFKSASGGGDSGGSGGNTGTKILHGTVTVTTDDKSIAITFDEAFTEPPVVLATIETEYSAGKVHGAYIYDISTTGFTATLTKISINSTASFVDGVVHWVAFGK